MLQVKVKVEGGVAVAIPKDIEAGFGEEIRFTSPEKAFRVVISPWPFKEPEHEVKTSQVLTFGKEGRFQYACFATPKGKGQREVSGSGGTGSVKPPGGK
jgi:plastocyanin